MPIKVVAHAGEQTREQHKASAIDLFFTCYVPPSRGGIGIHPEQFWP
jgi:hypothetical protein